MENEHIIVCGGQQPPAGIGKKFLALNLWGGKGVANIKFHIEDIHSRLLQNVPERFVDLLEIAAYLYCFDQGFARVRMDVESFGSAWRRRFKVYVPVRDPDFWNDAEVKRTLTDTLNFLSDEFFDFRFSKAYKPPELQEYLDFKESAGAEQTAEQVMMYSGGLDSLAGAIDEIITQKRQVVLVSHRSTPKLLGVHRRLEAMIVEKAGQKRPVQMNVRVSKKIVLDEEDHTQRSRSFLFGSLGATVATVLGLKNLRFYENGVLSMNLPMTAQLVGARATRTTHPRVIRGFSRLFSLVAGETFTVENPFIWNTKGEVIRKIVDAGCDAMIEASTSCPHTRQASKEQTHCGACSQCIDRRFGVIAAEAEEFDPPSIYRMDVFTESRSKEEDKLMVAAYLERANQVAKLGNANDFMSKYTELGRVIRCMDGAPDSVAGRIFELYKRHATEVNETVDKMMGKYRREIRERTLPGDCLLRLVYESGSVTSLPVQTAEPMDKTIVGAETKTAAFVFRKAGSVWDVVFDGGSLFHIDDGFGAKYLDYLLHRPNEVINAFDLEKAIRPAKGNARAKDSAQTAVDQQTKREAKEELPHLEAELETAEGEGDTAKVERLRGEIAKVKCVIGNENLLNGDAGERARDNVRKAINKVVQKMRKGSKEEQAFGQHIGQFVSLGYEVCYNQPNENSWA